MRITDCSSAWKDLEVRIYPNICLFHLLPIVCCAEKPEASVIPEVNKKPNSERISRQSIFNFVFSCFYDVFLNNVLIKKISLRYE